MVGNVEKKLNTVFVADCGIFHIHFDAASGKYEMFLDEVMMCLQHAASTEAVYQRRRDCRGCLRTGWGWHARRASE